MAPGNSRPGDGGAQRQWPKFWLALALALPVFVLLPRYLGSQGPALRAPSLGSAHTRPAAPYEARLAAWRPVLPADARRRGILTLGQDEALLRFAAKLLRGEPVKAVVVGGSISDNAGASTVAQGWPLRFLDWLNLTFPHPDHALINRAIAATNSAVHATCAEHFVPQDADMVVTEFSFNDADLTGWRDPARMGYEQLLRKLLRMASRPAVVQLHYYSWLYSYQSVPTGLHSNASIPGGEYWGGCEAQLGLFGEYYGLPQASMRRAAWPLLRENARGFRVDRTRNNHPPGYPWPILSPDDPEIDEFYHYDHVHPTNVGHQALADLMSELVLAALRAAERMDGREAAALAGPPAPRPLPPPAILGNADAPTSVCLMQEAFKGAVVEADGFEYKAERPERETFSLQKWGWTGQTPGAWAQLEVNTVADVGTGSTAKTNNTVHLGYMRGYESMGLASVECASGCACEPSVINGTWDRQATLVQLHEFKVTQHEACRLRVAILPDTASNGHKISLVSVMVASTPLQLPEMEWQADKMSGMVA